MLGVPTYKASIHKPVNGLEKFGATQQSVYVRGSKQKPPCRRKKYWQRWKLEQNSAPRPCRPARFREMAGDGHPQEPPQPGPHVKLTNLGRFSPGPSGPRGGGGCWGPFLRGTLLSRQPRSEAEEGYGAPAAEPCGGWCSRGRCRSIFLAAPGTDRGGRSAGRERGA